MMAGREVLSFFLVIIFISISGIETHIVLPPSLPPTLPPEPPRQWSIASPPKPSTISWPQSPAPSPGPPSSGGIKGGYWPSWLAETVPPNSIPTKYFTHLFYAFLSPDTTANNLTVTEQDERWMRNFTATLHHQTPPLKAFLSVGGANFSPGAFSTIVSNRDSRLAFINSCIYVAREYGFDGIDIDWEFPLTSQDMSNFSSLLFEFRVAMNNDSLISEKPRLLLSAAVYFASEFFLDQANPRTYPCRFMSMYLDFVNPLTYNYHGSWDTSVTGSHALLFDKSGNVSTSYGISTWVQNCLSPQKLVMGIPMFGRTWKLKDPNDHGIGAPATGTGPGQEGIMSYSDIVDFNLANNATVVFDNETVSTYAYSGNNWIGYDDAPSVVKKMEFAWENGLGGYFLWAIGQDKDWAVSEIASAAWDFFHQPPVGRV